VHKPLLIGLTLAIACAWMTAASDAQTSGQKAKQRKRPPAATGAFSRFAPGPEALARDLAKIQEERERYKGITVKPHPEAAGDIRDVHKSVAASLMKSDFVPPERLQRFQWIPQEMRTPITGWDATILSAAPIPGGIVVKMKVYPKHDGDAGFHAPNDYLIETYKVSGGTVKYVGSEGPPSRGILIFN
jgi:hypothetical protein